MPVETSNDNYRVIKSGLKESEGLNLPTVDGEANTVLTSDGSGNLDLQVLATLPRWNVTAVIT